MTNGLSLDLQLLQNLSDMTGVNGNNNVQNNKPAVYAKDGDPRYDEAMDYDGDGVVTMEEYQQYCEENNISTDEQVQNVQSMGDSVIAKQVSEASTGDNSKTEMAYDDYIKYCEENAVSSPSTQAAIKPENIQTNEAGLIIRNIGKALTSYHNNTINFPEPKIERNA